MPLSGWRRNSPTTLSARHFSAAKPRRERPLTSGDRPLVKPSVIGCNGSGNCLRRKDARPRISRGQTPAQLQTLAEEQDIAPLLTFTITVQFLHLVWVTEVRCAALSITSTHYMLSEREVTFCEHCSCGMLVALV